MAKDLYLEDGVGGHGINSRPEGSIYEVSFGHHSELHGYTALMSDMMKLSDIVGFESF
jgi:hypothetical protein